VFSSLLATLVSDLLTLGFMASVTHNIDKVVKRLDILQRRQLPFAAKQTVKEIGFQLAKKHLPAYMKAVFDNPVPLTTKSISYKVKSNFEVELSVRSDVGKGNAPANYLAPVAMSVEDDRAYLTKFSRFVERAGVNTERPYPVPVKENLAKNRYGNVSQGEYSKVWSGLNSSLMRSIKKSDLNPSLRFGSQPRRLVGFNRNNNFRYFSKNSAGQIYMGGAIQAPPTKNSLFDRIGSGIYRIKGKDNLQLLFTYAKSHPTVPKVFDYYGTVEKFVVNRADRFLERNIVRALR